MALFTFYTSKGFPSFRRNGARKGANGASAESERIARALRYGAGYIAVVGKDVEAAEQLVEVAVASAGIARVLRLSASTNRLSVLAREALEVEGPAEGPLVAIVSDADLGSVSRLELLRVQLESSVHDPALLRIVLIGGPVLQRLLDMPSARALASRLGLRVTLSGATRGRFSRA